MTDVSMMAASPLGSLFGEGTLGDESDTQLLDRFLRGGPDAGLAFEALMSRHGPMVLSVCRQVVGDRHEAEECFQATFLILVHRAGSIRRRPSAGPWLHGVARRVSLQARAARHRRERLALQIKDSFLSTDSKLPPAEIDELGPALHAEIARLPERYRAPITACYLQGRTIAEAAVLLGCPVGTVAGRLARARDRLRDRLSRRGLAPTLLAQVPASLVQSTRDAACKLADGGEWFAANSGSVPGLVKEFLRTLRWTRFRIGAVLLATTMTAWAVGLGFSPGSTPAPRSQPPESFATATETAPVRETLRQASQSAAELTDPEDRFAAFLAIAWAQIKHGEKAAARSNLDRALGSATSLSLAARCQAGARIALARGEADDRTSGLAMLARTREELEHPRKRRLAGSLKNIAVAQARLGDTAAAKETIKALEKGLHSTDEWRKRPNPGEMSGLIAAHLAAGDSDRAFDICLIPEDHWYRAELLYQFAATAAGTHPLDHDPYDPPTNPTPEERRRRLPVVRRAVAASEALPRASHRRAELAVILSKLGAFDDALQQARRIPPNVPPNPGNVDAAWAMQQIGHDQTRLGDREAARRTFLEAKRLQCGSNSGVNLRRVHLAGCLALGEDAEVRKGIDSLALEDRYAFLSSLAVRTRRAGDPEGARRLFHRALIEAHRYLDSLPGPEREGTPRPEDINARRIAGFLSEIAVIHAESGDWASVAKTWDAIEADERMRGSLAYQIATIRSRSGDVSGTLAWAKSLTSSHVRAWAIRGLAHGLFADDPDFD